MWFDYSHQFILNLLLICCTTLGMALNANRTLKSEKSVVYSDLWGLGIHLCPSESSSISCRSDFSSAKFSFLNWWAQDLVAYTCHQLAILTEDLIHPQTGPILPILHLFIFSLIFSLHLLQLSISALKMKIHGSLHQKDFFLSFQKRY